MSATLALEVRLDTPFDEAVERVTDELKREGFGILTRIDLHEAFRDKLGVETHEHAILGACNPRLAHRAVSTRSEISILLPCNVAVEAEPDGGTSVRITDPGALMAIGPFESEPAILQVATEAAARLGRVAEALASE